jgi:hypothetical protein
MALGLYMLVLFPPDGNGVILTPEVGLTAVAVYTAICGLTVRGGGS